MILVTILSFVRNFSAVFLQENLEDRLKNIPGNLLRYLRRYCGNVL